jgi:hypothetical protein
LFRQHQTISAQPAPSASVSSISSRLLASLIPLSLDEMENAQGSSYDCAGYNHLFLHISHFHGKIDKHHNS